MTDLTVSLVQTDLVWEDREANRDMLERRIKGIAERTNLIILPEMFTTGFSMQPETLHESMDGPSIGWMRRLAAAKGAIITGSLIIRDESGFRNRLIWMLPDGNLGYYDKRHCFSLAGEQEHYIPGNRRFIASVNGWRVNLCICYDLRFPVWTRQTPDTGNGRPEYDILVYVANWPEKRSQAWRTLLPARAVENQCYVIGVNRVGEDAQGNGHSGDSMVVDPLGDILLHNRFEECISTITLDRNHLEDVRSRMPFWRDADSFIIRP